MSRADRMRALLRELELLAERAREHERVMAAGVRAAAAWPDPDERDWVVRAAVDARIAREDSHARVAQGRMLLARLQTPGARLCADCRASAQPDVTPAPVVGATGSGKGSVLWSLLPSPPLAPVADGGEG